MNRILTASAALAAVLALGACSGEGNEQRAPDQENQAVNAVQDGASAVVGAGSAALASVSTDAYVPAAAISDMYEIESSKMAVGRTKSPEIKAYAQMMIDHHTKTTAELKPLATGVEGVTLPTAPDERRKGMLDNLRGASDADFDNTYLDQQTVAHVEALGVHEGYSRGGDNAGLKAFAAKTAPIVSAHLEQARKLDGTANADDMAKSAPPAGTAPAGSN
jgi:putative membrane protein